MRFGLAVGVGAWLVVVCAGIGVVWAYDHRPGIGAAAPGVWPAGSTLTRADDRPTLILLAHPQCSCTDATLTELAEALARAHRRPRTYVLFLKPIGMPQGWEATGLWERAARLPDATVLRDDDGQEAARLGAYTSGQVLLYGTNGRLLFSGGVTGSRGHAGDNDGRASLIALLNGEGSSLATTRVFGCALFSERG